MSVCICSLAMKLFLLCALSLFSASNAFPLSLLPFPTPRRRSLTADEMHLPHRPPPRVTAPCPVVARCSPRRHTLNSSMSHTLRAPSALPTSYPVPLDQCGPRSGAHRYVVAPISHLTQRYILHIRIATPAALLSCPPLYRPVQALPFPPSSRRTSVLLKAQSLTEA